MKIKQIKKWVKEDKMLIEAIKRYNQGEEIIDRAIELTLKKIKYIKGD